VNRRKRQEATLFIVGGRWGFTFSEKGPKDRKRAKKKAERAEFIANVRSGYGFRRIKAYRKRQPQRGEAQKAWRRYQLWKASQKND
jgi:hypothetical protein